MSGESSPRVTDSSFLVCSDSSKKKKNGTNLVAPALHPWDFTTSPNPAKSCHTRFRVNYIGVMGVRQSIQV